MKASKPKNGLGKVLAVALLITLIFVAGLITGRYVVSAPGLAKSETVSELGEMESASYIIFKESSTYYAKNRKTGATDYSGTDASKVIQQSLDALEGAHVQLRSGNYDIQSGIKLGNGDVLRGETVETTILRSSIKNREPVISTYGVSGSTPIFGTRISDLFIEGSGQEGDGIYFEYNVRNALIEHVKIFGVGGNGIHFYHSFSSKIFDVHIWGCGENGIKLEYKSHNVQIITSVSRRNTGWGLYANRSGAQLSVLGGNYEENLAGDIFLDFTRAVEIVGVYFENSHDGVYMIRIDSTDGVSYVKSVDISGCYFNGGVDKGANGIWLRRAIGVQINSVFMTSVNVGINITSGARGTLITNPYYEGVNTFLLDNGANTILFLDGYVTLPKRTHPNTVGWDSEKAGRIWFCTTHNYIEYWNGTDVIRVNQ